MPSFRSFLPALLTLTTTALSASSAEECPENWLPSTFHGTNCCYGFMQIEDRDAYCCVYDVVGEQEEYYSLSSKGALSTKTDDSISADVQTCFTRIPWTASDYSERVSSASSAAGATRTGPAKSEASSTSASSASASGSKGSASATATRAESASASASGSGSSTSNAAMPAVTAQGMVLGGAAIAAALFV